MSQLNLRVLSALFAIGLLVASYYFFSTTGIVALSLLVVTLGSIEYTAMVFKDIKYSKRASFNFVFFNLIILLTLLFYSHHSFEVLSISSALFISLNLWLGKNHWQNDDLIKIISLGAMGFIYCGVLPASALRILYLPQGGLWFATLLFIVFAADTFAYFFGRFWGKHKLFASLSPKKTREGALGGIIGSCMAVLVMNIFYLPKASSWELLVVALFASLLSQNGDLFESLIKRVVGVKDSGRIMPGHGGVLDRIDGVLFAAPVLYAYCSYSSTLLN